MQATQHAAHLGEVGPALSVIAAIRHCSTCDACVFLAGLYGDDVEKDYIIDALADATVSWRCGAAVPANALHQANLLVGSW